MKKKENENNKEKERPIKRENIELISLDNKPISKEVTKDPIIVHEKFIR